MLETDDNRAQSLLRRSILLIDSENGLWARRLGFAIQPGRPALFLDRDGVVVEEVHFLSRPHDVRLTEGVADAIAATNRAGLAVVIVTNQSGIARGILDWPAFELVQEEILQQLGAADAHIDAVFACGSAPPETANSADDVAAWRKPGAGMLLRAQNLLSVDLSRSFIVGDRLSDISAGFNAGLAGGWLVRTGYGEQEAARLDAAREGWRAKPFAVRTVTNAAEAIVAFLSIVR